MLTIDSILNYCSIFSPIQIKYHKTSKLYDDLVLLDSDTTDLKSNVIYLCYVSRLNNLQLDDTELTFFTINDCDISKDILHMKHLIIYKFPNTENMFSMYNYIERIFTKNKRNYTYVEDLIMSMLRNNDLNIIVDKVSLLIKNPIAIIDSSYKVISSSSSIKTDDDVWNTGLKRGSLTFEFIAQIKSIDNNNFEDNPDYKFLDFCGISKNRRKLCKLFIENTFLGYCLILESNTPFEDTPNSYYSLITDIISKQVSIRNMYQTQSFAMSYESILLDLVNESFVSKSIFLERIRNTKFDTDSKYIVVSIDMNNFIDNNSLIQGTLKEQINNLLPHSCSIFYDHYIVILININHTYYHDVNSFNNFVDMLVAYKLKAAFSDTFTDLYEVSSYYKQTVSVLHIANDIKDESPTILYDSYKLYDVIETLNSSRSPLSFCKNCVKEIYKYDHENNTEYIKTLYSYLNNGKSIAKTAEKLFIHRNTVNYRISRIKELFNIDFNNIDTNFEIYYSCLILNYLNKKNSK